MSAVTWLLLLSGVGLNAAAQLLLKAATRASGPLIADTGALSWQAAVRLVGAAPLWGGLACYAVSVFLWLGALSRVPVSVAYPMLSIGYIVNAIVAYFWFGEALAGQKLLGIGFIVIGVWLVAKS